MKTCAICKNECDTATCPKCGEASWLAVRLIEAVTGRRGLKDIVADDDVADIDEDMEAKIHAAINNNRTPKRSKAKVKK